jgi:hypothetical protein
MAMYTIYQLTLSAAGRPDKHYVGGTPRFGARTVEHRSKLRKGIHPNKEMQAAYNSGAIISFIVLDRARGPERAFRLETYWTDVLRGQGKIVFNRRADARSNLCLCHSIETKKRISQSLKGRNTRSPEAIRRASAKLRGRPKPPHVIAASQAGLKRWRSNPEKVFSAARKMAKLTDEQVRAIRASDGTCAALSKEFDISGATICHIKNGRKYRWVA